MSVSVARRLRAQPTEPERRMWALLWAFREAGWHFRRQAPIGRYFADFACLGVKLVIEVDGDTHGSDAAKAADLERDRYMEARGFLIVRYSNRDVMENGDGVATDIARILGAARATRNTPTPNPSPQGGGRRRSRKADDGLAPEKVKGSPPPLRGRDRVGGDP